MEAIVLSLLLSVKGRVERVEMQNTQFAILADEEKISMEGDYFVIAAAAYFFVETYIPDTYCESSIPMQTTIHEPIQTAGEIRG